jgi:methylenetetrahydrofolate dehydrogenase (NADP+)/methenyltetrahydrofolate cyclohydrolase
VESHNTQRWVARQFFNVLKSLFLSVIKATIICIIWQFNATYLANHSMKASLIDGKELATRIRGEVAAEVEARKNAGIRVPGLAVILVGTDHASEIYVKRKRIACEQAGIKSVFHPLPDAVTERELVSLIKTLNLDDTIDGILLQLPLPKHLDSEQMLELIDPKKDVDGFHPYNIGRLAQRRPLLQPCTPLGIMSLLSSINTPFKKQHAVVVGASNIVGRPMALELLAAGCTVTVCHRFTENLENFVRQADILVAAAGKPGLIKGEWIKPGATVIDVGINRLADDTITGDV